MPGTSRREFLGVAKYQPISPPGPIVTTNSPFSFTESITASGVKNAPTRFRPISYYTTTGRRYESALAVNLMMEQDPKPSVGQPGVRRSYFGDLPTVSPDWVLPNPDPSIRDRLVNECLKGMVDGKFNMLTSIAELRKTCEHLANTARRLTSAVTDVRRARFRQAATTLGITKPKRASRSKTWANNWLEYKYGWMPLILDAHGIVLHIASMLDREAQICTSRKRFTDRTVTPVAGQTELATFRSFWQGEVTLETRYQAVLLYQVDYNSLFNLQRLGLLDPGATAWETVPFSFVVDWFAPVGEWLSLMNAWQGVKFAGGGYTVTRKKTTQIWLKDSISIVNPKPDKFTAEMIRPCRQTTWTMTRSPFQDRPGYVFNVKSPVSMSNVITSIALLRKQFK